MVRGVDAANKTMSGGRISEANCFVHRARAINNAKRAEYQRNKKAARAQKELRIREDAIAAGVPSEREAALLEARKKREAKAAKAATFLAQAERDALAIESSDGPIDAASAEGISGVAASVVLRIRAISAAQPDAVELTIQPADVPLDRQHGCTYRAETILTKRTGNISRIVKAAPRARSTPTQVVDHIATLIRQPKAVGMFTPDASVVMCAQDTVISSPEGVSKAGRALPHAANKEEQGRHAAETSAINKTHPVHAYAKRPSSMPQQQVTLARIGKAKGLGYQGQP